MCQQLADEIQEVLDDIDVDTATAAELRAVVEHISDLVAGEEEKDDEDEDEDEDEEGVEVEEEEDGEEED